MSKFSNNYQIENIKNSNYNQNKKRIQEKDYCDTLCARDWKDPKCVQVGTLDIKGHDCVKRVYSQEGISPTLTDMQGGNRQPKIVEEKLPGAYGRDFGSKGKIQEEICDTLQAAMGCGGKNVPLVKKEVERTPLKFLNRNQKNIEGDYAFCVDSCQTGGIKETTETNIRIRKLTPKECWRLQRI